jgi:hypothetical protein
MTKKLRVLTDKQTGFLDALLGEAQGNYRQAMRIAGYSDSVPIREVTTSLKDEIVEQAKNYLAMNAPRAAMRLVEVMEDGSQAGAGNVMKAAQQVLDRAGARAPEENSQLRIPSGGMFIMPMKQLPAPYTVVEHDDEEYDEN